MNSHAHATNNAINPVTRAGISTNQIKALVSKTTATQAGIDTMPVRIAVGLIFAAHGAQKLFGWFGGYGLQGTAGWMESIGIAPGLLFATLAGSAEFFGGLALMAGLFTRPAALVLAFTMLVAIFSVHFQHGLFMSNNGYEYALALFVVSLSFVVRGAGSFSLDRMLTLRLAYQTRL